MGITEELGYYEPESTSIGRATFRDPAHQRALETSGYVILPLLDDARVAELVEGYDRIASSLGGANAPGDYNDTYAEFSIIHSKPEFRRQAHDLITSVLVPATDELLVGHRPLIANFVNKPPGTGVVPAHQNFSVVDERRFRSVSVWVALVDCVMENGAMSMLDGSHNRLRGRRGMWAYTAFSGIEQDIIERFLTPVEVPAGHAVILDDALVHYSPANRSAERRLAIQFVMVPDDSTPMWFQQVGATDGRFDVNVWEVEERFFFDFWHGDGDERFGRRVERINVPATALDLANLQTLLGHLDSDPAGGAPRSVPPTVHLQEAPATVKPPQPFQQRVRAWISRSSK